MCQLSEFRHYNISYLQFKIQFVLKILIPNISLFVEEVIKNKTLYITVWFSP